MQKYSEFGLKARAIMFKRKITLTALAKEIGISTSYVSEILKGTREGESQKKRIMEALGMTSQE